MAGKLAVAEKLDWTPQGSKKLNFFDFFIYIYILIFWLKKKIFLYFYMCFFFFEHSGGLEQLRARQKRGTWVSRCRIPMDFRFGLPLWQGWD